VSIVTHGPNEQPILLSYLPFFHIYGLLAVLILGLANASKIVTLPRFSVNELLGCIEKFKVNIYPLSSVEDLSICCT
jgi:acyl-CoA synthetase (AMP-forming)/AMP-acid ligase II